jgi:hypothetical protein
MSARFLSVFLFIMLYTRAAYGQNIHGQVVEDSAKTPMSNVAVVNIHTGQGVMTDLNGNFDLTAEKGQLIEFKRLGYKVARVRVPGIIPPFFKIVMSKGAIELPEYVVNGIANDYVADSLRYRELYARELDLPEMSGLDMIQHPFSALSKRNREIWAFQKTYQYHQREKYIDYRFNDKLITQITGLKGDVLAAYKARYRPSYEQLRSMSEYSYYSYIKKTAAGFERTYGKPSINRNSGN